MSRSVRAERVHSWLAGIKLCYLAVLPAVGLWSMREFVTEDNALLYFVGGLFAVALYLGLVTELVGRMQTLSEQLWDAVCSLATLVWAMVTVDGGRSLAAFWIYETLGICGAIMVLILAKKPLESWVEKHFPHVLIQMPSGGFPGMGILLFFSAILAMFLWLVWPVLQGLALWSLVPAVLWAALVNLARIMVHDRQPGGEGAILFGVFSWILAVGLSVVY
jgi:hypothetical protein